MRVFLAGATGVIGVRQAGQVRALGAEPVLCDVFDRRQLTRAMAGFRPDCVLHQLTDLPDDVRRLPERTAANNRIRREGTRNLVDAADALPVIAQSVAWNLPGDSGTAVAEHERAVLGAGGVVVRYGQFYGPGTYYPTGLPPGPRIRLDSAARRTLPLITAPSGVVVLVDD